MIRTFQLFLLKITLIMQRMSVSAAQVMCLNKNIPFYSYRLPGQREFYFGAQVSGEPVRFESVNDCRAGEGFIAVPFQTDAECWPVYIQGELAFREVTEDAGIIEKLESYTQKKSKPVESQPSVSREAYHEQVSTMISTLKQGEVRKMVLARGLTVVADGFREASMWFEKLAERYSDAFVFLVSVPGVMTWMGATPELFLEQTQQGTSTMALAGTRPSGALENWGEKEVEEQAIVADYVEKLLRDTGDWEVKGPFSKQAGRVEHLCTAFTSLQCLSAGQVDRLRQALHPTPAVGGFPAREAIRMIRQIEGESRRYYAGYVGPLSADGTFHWFVNLRSMELFEKAVRLYIGGGITALSDPEKEWGETELKSRTLLDVMNNVLMC